MSASPRQSDNGVSGNVFLHHDGPAGHEAVQATCPVSTTGGWKKRFPNLLTGNAFLQRIEADMIVPTTVLLLRVVLDHADCSESDPVADDAGPFDPYIRAGTLLDAACSDTGGVWGVLWDDLLAWCLPGRDAASGIRAANALIKDFQDAAPYALFAGVTDGDGETMRPDELFHDARKALDHAAFLTPGAVVLCDAISFNISGDRHYAKGDLKQAMAEYEQALTRAPDNSNVLNSLGVCYAMLGAYEKSIRLFDRSLAVDEGDHMAMYNIGQAHLLMGDPETALTHFQNASEKNGGVYEVAFQIGKLLLDDGHTNRAVDHLEKAAALKPDSALAHKYLGRCMEAEGNWERATHAFKKAVKHNPNDAESLSALGYLFDKKGESPVLTTIFCQQSVDIEPDNGLYRQRLGHLYLKQNQLTDALEAFRAADRLGLASTEMIETVLARMDEEQQTGSEK